MKDIFDIIITLAVFIILAIFSGKTDEKKSKTLPKLHETKFLLPIIFQER